MIQIDNMRLALLMAVFIGLIHGLVARQNVGCFKTRWHGITGDVFVENSYELTIENFNYDGLGPGGVYFNVGMSYQLYLSDCFENVKPFKITGLRQNMQVAF